MFDTFKIFCSLYERKDIYLLKTLVDSIEYMCIDQSSDMHCYMSFYSFSLVNDRLRALGVNLKKKAFGWALVQTDCLIRLGRLSKNK